MSNLMAVPLQALCARLGIGAGRDLAQARAASGSSSSAAIALIGAAHLFGAESDMIRGGLLGSWVHAGGRVFTQSIKELAAWRGNRGDAGRMRPDRFLTNNKFGSLQATNGNGKGREEK